FAEKYLRQGTKIAITGRIQTGSYTNREGQKVYTTDVVVEEQEFAESKNAGGNNGGYSAPQHNNPAPSANTSDLGSADGFMNIPDGIDEELPFN
ncbi:MAG: single-stranded DNA-binding protein, partial [Fusicatenibacter saccharivorans]